MDANLWTQLLIAIVPALITGVGSLIIALKKCKNEINTLETNNKHEIEKLMKQHEIDIEALKEKHKLDMETKEKEHKLKIEEIKVQNEQEILKNIERKKNRCYNYCTENFAYEGNYSNTLEIFLQ
mgnify:CR=1 FL=1